MQPQQSQGAPTQGRCNPPSHITALQSRSTLHRSGRDNNMRASGTQGEPG